ncbi:MAG: adenosylcobinamide-GDP ribazoletransferase [Actinobacteria bacterium]|nr:adenosylcobinamide-GDP ribazoletransferase [Actinomycetota bacterium]MDI6831556.1 adenosylcobinamide-GDP ribazoletransferase [Actinomycetota bacterium]
MGALSDAFRFLTALPLPQRRGDEGTLAASLSYFPLVGAVIGGALVLTDWACGLAFPRATHFLSAALVLAVYAFLTGGLHHDGLMDVADAFWGRRSREERLRIMKDARAGALGVTAVVLFLLVELAALYALPAHVDASPGRLRWAALLSFPVLGRWMMCYLCVRFPYAREEGTGAVFVKEAAYSSLAPASALTLAVLAGCFVFLACVPMLIAALSILALAFAEASGGYFMRALGGVTGDCVGAAAMFCEALVLLLLASRLPELLL